MGWGTSAWGTSPWGGIGASGGSLQLVGAHARGTVVVRVRFSDPPSTTGVLGTGSALNPRSYAVSRADTGASFTVLSVRQVNAAEFELYLLQKLGPFGVSHTVVASVVDTLGGAIDASANEVSFDGVAAQLRAGQLFATAPVDLARVSVADGSGTAVYQVGKNGDYVLHGGELLLRKLFTRRLTTNLGEFFHLTTYGVGIGLKAPLSSSRLVEIRTRSQLQLLEEPEVEKAQISLRLSTDGVLLILIQARLRSTGEVKTQFSVPVVQL